MQKGRLAQGLQSRQTFPTACQSGDQPGSFREWLQQAAPIITICIRMQGGEQLISTPQPCVSSGGLRAVHDRGKAELGTPREGLWIGIFIPPAWSEFGSGFTFPQLCDPGADLHALTPVCSTPGAQSSPSLPAPPLGHHHPQASQNRDLSPTKPPIFSLLSVQLGAQNSDDEFHIFHQSRFSSQCWNPASWARFDEDGMAVPAFLISSYSIFLLVQANTLVLVENHSGTLFTPIFVPRYLSLPQDWQWQGKTGRRRAARLQKSVIFAQIKEWMLCSILNSATAGWRLAKYLSHFSQRENGSNAPASLCLLKQALFV